MTATTKAAQCLEGMMNSICGWLKLTMETEEMFSGRLPTLDLEIWIEEVTNKIMFTFYEKPMVARTVLMKRSAMPENTRMATLNQEMIRRMVNTSEMVGEEERCEIVDKYATKLVNSEYSVATTRKIITGGLKGYERMLSKSRNRNEPGWKPLHMPASFKSKERRTAKMLAKTNWFKSRQEQGKDVQDDPVSTEGRKVRNPAGSSLEESPMTINASRMGMEEGGMNVLTGSLSGNKSGSKKMRGPGRPT